MGVPSPRTLRYDGPGTPLPCAVPEYSSNDQPLYGLGSDPKAPLKPLYLRVQPEPCFVDSFISEFCFAATRNSPYTSTSDTPPALVAWPTTVAHVQALVAFAARHSLCVSVAGTGHDFLNRHSSASPHGLIVRTSLFQTLGYVNDDPASHALRVGAGATFSQIHAFVAQHGQVVSSGWASSVGIAGWSTGGGHGPFAPSLGLGADNVLAVEVVTASGKIVEASPMQNADLFYALRGGGGSVWGIITAFTIRTHDIPSGGFTQGLAFWKGSLCDEARAPGYGLDTLNSLIDAHVAWGLTLDASWGGLTWITFDEDDGSECGSYSFLELFVFSGAATSANFTGPWSSITGRSGSVPPASFSNVSSFATWWDRMAVQPIEYIVPVPTYVPSPGRYAGGVPSVILSRATVQASLADVLKSRVSVCVQGGSCSRLEIYQDITGNIGSPQLGGTALSPGMRSGMVHFVFGAASNDDAAKLYALGQNSYFAESAYELPNWKDRYWGKAGYAKLAAIKAAYDPAGLFHCHHCVSPAPTPAPGPEPTEQDERFFTSIMPWMGLERTGENIPHDLKQLVAHTPPLTSVAYEAYNLGPGGTLVYNNFTNVGPTLAAAGLATYAQVSTCCPWGRPQVIEWVREAVANPKPFVDAALAAIDKLGFDGFNIDIEPLNGTHADALGFNTLLNRLADGLHARGKTLSVDVGTWTPFFNVTVLADSAVDHIVLMGTYTGNFDLFRTFIDDALAAGVTPERLVVGLETVNPNTNKPYTLAEMDERLAFVRSRHVRNLAIWDAPIPDSWWPLLNQAAHARV